jgi:hypothetical protein
VSTRRAARLDEEFALNLRFLFATMKSWVFPIYLTIGIIDS